MQGPPGSWPVQVGGQQAAGIEEKEGSWGPALSVLVPGGHGAQQESPGQPGVRVRLKVKVRHATADQEVQRAVGSAQEAERKSGCVLPGCGET